MERNGGIVYLYGVLLAAVSLTIKCLSIDAASIIFHVTATNPLTTLPYPLHPLFYSTMPRMHSSRALKITSVLPYKKTEKF